MKVLLKFIGFLAAASLLTLVMAYLAGFFQAKITTQPIVVAAQQASGALLEVAQVREPIIERASGTLRAKNETAISPRISATIASVNVRAGDSVRAGDELITLDSRELQARLQQQEQEIAAAKTRLTEAEANFERIQSLWQRKVASKTEFDRSQTEFRTTQIELTRNLRKAEEVATALSHSVIKAPITGRVIDRYVEPGDLALPGKLMLRLYEPGTLRLEANVRESLAAALLKGDQLTAHIDALGKDFPVQIDEIVPSADPGSRSFLVKALLSIQANLYPGMFGRLLIPSGESEKLYVPATAVSRVGQLEFVLAESGGSLVRRYIRTGATVEGQVEVLSGLAAGEYVCCQ